MNYFSPRRRTLGDLLDSTSASNNGVELKLAVLASAESRGFPMLTYHMIAADGLPPPIATHFTNYPEEWVSHYISANLYFRDPVIEHGQKAVSPFSWDEIADRETDRTRLTVFDQATDFQVRHGLTIPVRGPRDLALVSMCPEVLERREADGLIEAHLGEMVLLAMMAHEKARHFLEPRSLTGDSPIRLSRREKEVMQWISCGKSAWEIGQILALSEATIRHYTAAALAKLNCHDKTHAAVRAVVMGLIEPPY